MHEFTMSMNHEYILLGDITIKITDKRAKLYHIRKKVVTKQGKTHKIYVFETAL